MIRASASYTSEWGSFVLLKMDCKVSMRRQFEHVTPGTIARRKSPVIPISVMPLRENEKVYPVTCAEIRSRAAARKT